MNKEKIYIELEDGLSQILNYITSGELHHNTNFLSDAERSSYMAALGMAGCIISSRCQKYRLVENLVATDKDEAHWILKEGVLHPLETDGICSHCGYTTGFYSLYKFCPNCGFHMKEIKDNESN